MWSQSWFENGDQTPISPLFPVAHGLSFTTFNISGLTAPANVSIGSAATKFNMTVAVANTGSVDGAVTIFATYYKQTDGVVRWARMLCGFSKVHVAAGSTVQASVEVEVADLARWDPEEASTNLLGGAVKGAYVVDGGVHEMEVGQCIDSGVSYGVTGRTCMPLAAGEYTSNPHHSLISRVCLKDCV